MKRTMAILFVVLLWATGAAAADRHRLLNVGCGAPIKLLDFVHAIERAAGRKAAIELAPMQPGDVEATWASTERLRAEIGYAPATPLEEGIARFVAWYRSYYAGRTKKGSEAAA